MNTHTITTPEGEEDCPFALATVAFNDERVFVQSRAHLKQMEGDLQTDEMRADHANILRSLNEQQADFISKLTGFLTYWNGELASMQANR